MDERKRYDEGMKARRAVLGDAHVDRAQKNRTAFNEPFQDLITRYAWGEIWSRPGLPRKTRSLLTLSMLVALNRNEELRMHLKAALAIGISRDEIQEVFKNFRSLFTALIYHIKKLIFRVLFSHKICTSFNVFDRRTKIMHHHTNRFTYGRQFFLLQ